MCLRTVSERRRPTMKQYTAYQVFRLKTFSGLRRSRSKLMPLYMPALQVDARLGVWHVAKNAKSGLATTPISTGMLDASYQSIKYPPGFHCYLLRQDAEAKRAAQLPLVPMDVVVREVKIRKVHTIGYESGREIWVAKERMILPLRRKKGV